MRVQFGARPLEFGKGGPASLPLCNVDDLG